jgi:hypothetical protein
VNIKRQTAQEANLVELMRRLEHLEQFEKDRMSNSDICNASAAYSFKLDPWNSNDSNKSDQQLASRRVAESSAYSWRARPR